MARKAARMVFSTIQRIEEACLAGGILAIAGLTIANVIARTLSGKSIVYAEEISQFAMIFVTFIGASYAASKGRHIRMTAIYDNLPLRAQKTLMTLMTALTSLLLFALAYFAVHYALVVRALGTVSPALQVPLWLVYLAAPLGLGLGGVQYALAFIKNLQTKDVYLSFDVKDEYEVVDSAL